jgi:protein-S-isoprenylcysteine O-methyltransferase Ste14
MAGPPSLRASRTYAAVQFVLLAIYAAVLLWNPGEPLLAAPSLALAGIVLGVAGLAVIALGFLALGRNIQVAPHTKEGAHLVQSGIYRVLRHPIYSGIALCVVGLWLREPTAAAGIAGLVVIAFLGVKRRVEERFLLAAYPEYAGYRKRTVAFP